MEKRSQQSGTGRNEAKELRKIPTWVDDLVAPSLDLANTQDLRYFVECDHLHHHPNQPSLLLPLEVKEIGPSQFFELGKERPRTSCPSLSFLP